MIIHLISTTKTISLVKQETSLYLRSKKQVYIYAARNKFIFTQHLNKI